MDEIWKEIKGYEGLYEVSNMGNIKSLPKAHGTVIYHTPTILKGSLDKDGYHRVTLRKNLQSKTIKVHRIVALAFIDNPDDLPQINHIDGNKDNNRADNLEWCDCLYNIRHAVSTGLRSESYQNKSVAVTYLITNKCIVFKSYKEASEYMGHSRNYIAKMKHRRKKSNFIAGEYYVRT